MKLCIAGLIILVCSSSILKNEMLENSTNFCDYIKSTKSLTKLHFVPKDLHKFDTTGLKRISPKYLQFLFKDEMISSNKVYLYRQFNITNSRIGLICFNKTRECDHDVNYFSLHIIDNCNSVKNYITITLSDDEVILYDISSSINKTLDTLTLKKQTTSEWLAGSNLNTDTLFTDIYKVNLKSNNLDTVSTRSFYKKIKYNH